MYYGTSIHVLYNICIHITENDSNNDKNSVVVLKLVCK